MESLSPNSRQAGLTKRACRSPTRLIDASAKNRAVFNESALRLKDCHCLTVGKSQGGTVEDAGDLLSWPLVKIELSLLTGRPAKGP